MISTHILDTHLGKPANNVEIKLFAADGKLLATTFTNEDGRVLANDFGLERIQAGDYSLEFSTKSYFSAQHLETFFPKAVVHFSVENAEQHYHIPLLISPFAYSTYRGS